MTIQELRDKLGLKPGQLITNMTGQTGDLLGVDGDNAMIGVLDTGRVVTVPISNLLTSDPRKLNT